MLDRGRKGSRVDLAFDAHVSAGIQRSCHIEEGGVTRGVAKADFAADRIWAKKEVGMECYPTAEVQEPAGYET